MSVIIGGHGGARERQSTNRKITRDRGLAVLTDLKTREGVVARIDRQASCSSLVPTLTASV